MFDYNAAALRPTATLAKNLAIKNSEYTSFVAQGQMFKMPPPLRPHDELIQFIGWTMRWTSICTMALYEYHEMRAFWITCILGEYRMASTQWRNEGGGR